jgi:CheY-like chemotaxis protein
MSNPAPSWFDNPPCAPASPALRERDDRLELLKILAMRMAHEFNNFLAPVLGYITLIKEDQPPGGEILGYAVAMENSARNTEAFLERVLFALRPRRRFNPARIALDRLVAEEVSHWADGLPRNAGITLRTALVPCTIIADAVQWRQVIQQLLSNARFGLVTGGTLSIRLQSHTLDESERTQLGIRERDSWRLEISDTGIGMSAESVGRAFEPFFTTRAKGQTLGLGLTLVHGVTRLHGGQVRLESREEQGTAVTIWIPAAPAGFEPGRSHRPRPAAKAPHAAPRGRKILLVDDDPLVREVLKECMIRLKLDVLVAQDGLEGLHMARKHRQELFLVVSDLAMPAMSGAAMLLEMRREKLGVPVLLVSGDADTMIQEELAQLGEDVPRLIKKPFSARDLMDAVRGYL